MTEPRYGGINSQGARGTKINRASNKNGLRMTEGKKDDEDSTRVIDSEAEKKFLKAGEIAIQAMKFAEQLCKPETPLLEIAEKAEEFILKHAEIAFPIDLSINEKAAHYSPVVNDKTIAHGLLKIDMGVSIDGYVVDLARSLDLTSNNEYADIIKASRDALKNVRKILRYGIEIRQIGKIVHKTITDLGLSPVRNLSGHEIARYKIHAGISIPNYDNNNSNELPEGIFAIEPFATTGEGLVTDGKPCGVYELLQKKAIRDSKAREILQFIEQTYNTLPFSERWIFNKFGQRGMLALSILQRDKCVKQYPELIEKTRAPVSQYENTFLVKKNKVIVLTEE
ncbi:type II methionyl aminopeptidase [Candidatus Pacearchaeota archaeon]|nr:type II methionyl aminopeptidase [Candidatus Pacearchaeota archaeon]